MPRADGNSAMCTLNKSMGWNCTSRRRLHTAAAVLLLGLATPSTAFGQARMPGPVKGKATVQVRGAVAQPERVSVLVHLAAGTARGPIRDFAANRGGVIKYEYDVVLPNVINLRGIPRNAIDALAVIPGVLFVEEDRVMHAHLTQSTPLIRALQSQITGAGLSADGSGVRVCIVDTGIDSDHLMYATRIDTAAGRDFVNNDNDPEDDNGHGSNVAGIALGGVGLSLNVCSVLETFQGVAPAATLIGIKVLGSTGSGAFSDVIAGINYGADQTAGGGRCDVMNLSLGGGAFAGNCDSDTAAIAANNAVAAGVVFVSSAGNEGNANAMGTPACASGAIAVGAVYDDNFPNCYDTTEDFVWCLGNPCTPMARCTDSAPVLQDSLTCFSNQSDTIDVAAPGCVATSANNAAGGSTVSGQCGTSQASPHVAGLAALILSADPSLTPAEVRQIIRDGAIDLGPVGFDRGYGFGRIDAINSLSLVNPCDDGLACTTDTFNDITMLCEFSTDAGACLIGGTCFNDGDRNPANDCESCGSALDQTDWSLLPVSTLCELDADACTQDRCDGFGTCGFESFATQIDLNLEVEGLTNAVTRSVTFVMTDCQGGTDTLVKPIDFDSVGVGSVSLLGVDPGADWVHVTEGHTLGKRLPVSINQAGGCLATVNFTGTDRLFSGDFSNAFVPQDNMIGIQDFSILAIQWNQPVLPELGTLADVTGDGVQGNADFSAMVNHFAEAGDAPDLCPASVTLDHIGQVVRLEPTTRLLVDEATMAGAERADLNADGVIDTRDIRAFAVFHNLPLTAEVSARLTRLERDAAAAGESPSPKRSRQVRDRK